MMDTGYRLVALSLGVFPLFIGESAQDVQLVDFCLCESSYSLALVVDMGGADSARLSSQLPRDGPSICVGSGGFGYGLLNLQIPIMKAFAANAEERGATIT